MPSNLHTSVSQDDPATLAAGYVPDRTDRRFIDDQIQALQEHILRSNLRGVHGTWMMLDPGQSRNGQAGDCVCLSPGSALADTVTLATTASLAASGGVFGVLSAAYAKGSLCHVATGGALPPSVTGLGTTAGVVRANGTTSKCERVASLSGGDYQVGRVDAAGNLVILKGTASNTSDWTGFTPTMVAAGGGFSLGNGTLSCFWRKLARDTIDVQFGLQVGSTTNFGTGVTRAQLNITSSEGSWRIDSSKLPLGTLMPASTAFLTDIDVATNAFSGTLGFVDSNTVTVVPAGVGAFITGTVPFTWATGDLLQWAARFPAQLF